MPQPFPGTCGFIPWGALNLQVQRAFSFGAESNGGLVSANTVNRLVAHSMPRAQHAAVSDRKYLFPIVEFRDQYARASNSPVGSGQRLSICPVTNVVPLVPIFPLRDVLVLISPVTSIPVV